MMMSAVVMAFVVASCGEVEIERIDSSAYIQTTDVKGESKNCAVVLRAQQGISYTISVTSEDNWATFSGGKTSVEGVM